MYEIQPTNSDISRYLLARKIAQDSSAPDRHGCVIIRSGTVLSVATNRRVISHPVSFKWFKQDIHAEQRALLRVKNPSGATLYSARDHRNLCSIPCNMCWTLLENAGISWVVFHDGIEIRKVKI